MAGTFEILVEFSITKNDKAHNESDKTFISLSLSAELVYELLTLKKQHPFSVNPSELSNLELFAQVVLYS